MTNQSTPPADFNDFLDAWRQTAAETEQRWNDYLNQMMGTEAFGQAMARSMDGYLSMQATFARGMEQYLRALNIPTRSDITQLAERVAMLEQKIDSMALMLGSPERAGVEAAPTPGNGATNRRGKGARRRAATAEK